MALKKGGLRGSLRNITTGAGAIPDSVDYQFVANSWTEGTDWVDELAGVTHELQGSPTLNSDALNGNDYIGFDGTDDGFKDTDAEITFSQPNGIVMVGRIDSIGSQATDNRFWDASGDRQILQVNADSNFEAYAGANLTDGGANTNWHIFNILYDGSSGNLRIDSGNFADVTGNIGSNGLSEVTVAATFDLGTFADISVAEIWYMNNPSSSDRADADQILNDKYGVY